MEQEQGTEAVRWNRSRGVRSRRNGMEQNNARLVVVVAVIEREVVVVVCCED
jgi:hypothetical protein